MERLGADGMKVTKTRRTFRRRLGKTKLRTIRVGGKSVIASRTFLSQLVFETETTPIPTVDHLANDRLIADIEERQESLLTEIDGLEKKSLEALDRWANRTSVLHA